MSECFTLYQQLGSISTVKTSLNLFSLGQKQVWTYSVLGNRIYQVRCLFVAVGFNALVLVLM